MQYNKLGKFIRENRERLKISLNEFAFSCGIEPATLSNFETGKSGITLDTAISIANGFNKRLSELFFEYEKYSEKNLDE